MTLSTFKMTSKSLSLATGLFLFLGALHPPVHAAETKAAGVQVLNIGSDMTFPPYEYLEDGKPNGVDVQIMKKMAEMNGGLTPNWIDTRWVNLIPGLKGAKFDVIYSSMYITKERLAQIDMIPYLKTDISLLVLKGASYQPKTPMDLCGHTVGAMKGTAFVAQVQSISQDRCVAQGKKGIVIREFDTSPQTTQALLAHAVEVQYDDAAVMKAALKSLPKRVEISSTESFFPVVSGIGVRKGDTKTHALISSGLEKMKQSGDLKRILDEYGIQEPSADDIKRVMN